MSTLTTNLNLIKYELTDNVTPSGYNDNFDTIDTQITGLKVDFIVAQGIENGWIYRRWNSGVAECWRNVEHSNISVTTAWGSIYETPEAYGAPNYPFTFIETPIVNLNVQKTTSTSGSYAIMGIERGSSSASTTSPGSWYYLRATSGTGITVTTSIYVIGRWR